MSLDTSVSNAGQTGRTERKKTHKYIIVHFSCQKVGEFNKKPHFDIYNLKKVTYSHQSGSYVFKKIQLQEKEVGVIFGNI